MQPGKRIKSVYNELVPISVEIKELLWDIQNDEVQLEKLIVRVLTYGKFDEIKMTYDKFPNQCIDIIQRHDYISRGVKFWIRRWSEPDN